MTMPHLMNCGHSEDGWCLACVESLWEESQKITAERDKLQEDLDVARTVKPNEYELIRSSERAAHESLRAERLKTHQLTAERDALLPEAAAAQRMREAIGKLPPGLWDADKKAIDACHAAAAPGAGQTLLDRLERQRQLLERQKEQYETARIKNDAMAKELESLREEVKKRESDRQYLLHVHDSLHVQATEKIEEQRTEIAAMADRLAKAEAAAEQREGAIHALLSNAKARGWGWPVAIEHIVEAALAAPAAGSGQGAPGKEGGK